MSADAATKQKKIAVITGASGGIGMELARLCAADGHDLIVTARRIEQLHGLAQELEAAFSVRVHVIQLDIAQAGAAALLWQRISAITPAIDVFINNAGVGDSGDFAAAVPATLEHMIELNIASLTLLTRLVLPGMLARRQGKILNVASLAGFQPGGPGMSVYYASKSYVLSFSRGIRRELAGTGVSVTVLCPGATATGFEQAAHAQATRLFHWTRPMDAVTVARSGYQGMQRGGGVVIPGLLNKFLAYSASLSPAAIALEINRYLLAARN